MPSRKKDRGKQRKARQKDNRDFNNEGAPIHAMSGAHASTQQIEETTRQLKSEGCRIVTKDDGSTLILHPNMHRGADREAFLNRELLSDKQKQELAENYLHNYAQDLREGESHGTEVIARNTADSHLSQQMGYELIKADIHLSMLHFLNQSDRSVSDVLGRVVDAGDSAKLPFCWVGILGLLAQDGLSDRDGVRLTLAKGIEPYLMTVIDDKRELFQSNLIWYLCLSSFFSIARDIMMSKGAFLVMISYEGFLPFLAQASCWSQSREDIKEECRMLRQRHPLESSVCPGPKSLASGHAQRVIATILLGHGDDKSADTRRALDQIACAPLCGNDPNCNDSTMAGFIRMLNEKSDETNHELLFDCIVKPLLLEHGYVDARVIAELIEFGNQSMAAAETVLYTILTLLGLGADYEHIQMIDSRYAAAICHGLLEFCVGALLAYGNEKDCKIGGDLFFLADGLHLIAMHSKTSRALQEKKAEITTALDALRKKSVSRATEICSLIDDAVGARSCAVCCNCLKDVDRKDLLYCKRCGVECYCSLACQSESYGLGHEKTCKEEVEFIDRMRDEGLSETKIKRLRVLSSNLMMNGCRLIRNKAADFLDEDGNAAEVRIDFGVYPPDVDVSRSDDGEPSGSSLKCTFIAPVFYGFAHLVNVEAYFLKKVISKRSWAEPSSGAGTLDRRN